jgi:hypothetical protein
LQWKYSPIYNQPSKGVPISHTRMSDNYLYANASGFRRYYCLSPPFTSHVLTLGGSRWLKSTTLMLKGRKKSSSNPIQSQRTIPLSFSNLLPHNQSEEAIVRRSIIATIIRYTKKKKGIYYYYIHSRVLYFILNIS